MIILFKQDWQNSFHLKHDMFVIYEMYARMYI